MSLISKILFFILATNVQAQEIRSFGSHLKESMPKNGFYILKGDNSCYECYGELFSFLIENVDIDSTIYFLVVSASSPIEKRNELNNLMKQYKLKPSQILFLEPNDLFLLKGQSDEPYHPKLLYIDCSSNLHMFNYSMIFNSHGIKKRAVRKLIKFKHC